MRNRILLSVAAASAVLMLAACGSSTKVAASTASTTPASATPNASANDSTAPSAAPAGSTATSGGGANIRAALQSWEACLTSNGVTLPSTAFGAGGFGNGSRPANAGGSAPVSGGPRNGGGGLQSLNSFLAEPANSTAVAACKSLQPTFGGGGNRGNGANRAAYQAYLSCLASNGVTVPTVDTTQTSQPPRQTVDTADPNFAAANAKCAVLLPQNTGGSGAPAPGATTGAAATTGA